MLSGSSLDGDATTTTNQLCQVEGNSFDIPIQHHVAYGKINYFPNS